ncbi:MAG TPA: amidase [Chloroflexota bacterium]|nr:amidase [Chloroflexota bacterium]
MASAAGGPRPGHGLEAAPEPRGVPILTAAALAKEYEAGHISPLEATREALRRVERLQPRLNAFITVLSESALDEAAAAEARWRAGRPLSRLDGVPVGLKDLIHVAGVPTTAASTILKGAVAGADSEVVRRLRGGGAVILGKTNLHEFAYGPTGDVSAYGAARNPWDERRITGGSSSGSAAAVAGGMCPLALGSDTGGSVRIPSALCGLVGLKPTYGRVPCGDVLPLSWSLDHLGPMASCVEDAASAYALLAGAAPVQLAGEGKRDLRIGLCRELFFGPMEAEVRRLVEAALPRLGQVREVSIAHIGLAPYVVQAIMAPEALAFHRPWLDTRRDDYQRATFSLPQRLLAAEEISAVDYVQASRLRALLIEEMEAALDDLDVLAMPTVPLAAPLLGQAEVELDDGSRALPAGITTRNTAPLNVTGFPAISLPCGLTTAGLPVGLQLVARPWQEDWLLQAAYRCEGHLNQHVPRLPEL